MKNRENHVWDEKPEITLVIVFVILPQKSQIGLKNESFESSRNSP